MQPEGPGTKLFKDDGLPSGVKALYSSEARILSYRPDPHKRKNYLGVQDLLLLGLRWRGEKLAFAT